MGVLRPRSTSDLVAGLVFLGLGAAFAIGALGYDLGSLLEMGPGYVPLTLGVVLAALGLATAIKAYVAPDPASGEAPTGPVADAPVPAPVSDAVVSDGPLTDGGPADAEELDTRPLAGIQWRPTVGVFAAVTFFALTIDGLGLLPATFGTGLLAALARPGTRLVRALVISVSLTLASWIIFVVLLQLRLALFGDWLGG
ncbi:tripartite tricarboxylate transporter TctB family protein [Promicromonospora vindobonensis]|uniref:Tripartite tricarboxylate transporter TctB family protein n=1 Tax=Promicromonospora vindobonensis TaxID=195748 RepID=A0ABW5VRN3_9MICO